MWEGKEEKGSMSDKAGKWETVFGRSRNKGSKFHLGHVEFGGISVCSSPFENLVQDYNLKFFYTSEMRDFPGVGNVNFLEGRTENQILETILF